MINKVNPGLLKHKILFYKNGVIIDDDGFKTSSLTNFLTTKCALLANTYTDNRRGNSKSFDSSSANLTCVVRFNKDISSKCIVEIFDKKYRIKSIEMVDFNRYLKLVLQNV